MCKTQQNSIFQVTNVQHYKITHGGRMGFDATGKEKLSIWFLIAHCKWALKKMPLVDIWFNIKVE